jgi:hypothetical protein
MTKNEENFLQPIVSTLGLTISVISTIVPIFSKTIVTQFFIKKELIVLSSFLSFILGIALIWIINSFYRSINFTIGKFKDRGKGFSEPWKRFDTKKVLMIMLIIDIIFGILFMYLSQFKEANFTVGLIQALVYIIFFLFLISIFAILVVNTLQMSKFKEEKKNFPNKIYETLTRNGLLNSGVEIVENRQLTQKEIEKYDVQPFIGRFLKIQTKSQNDNTLKLIISYDGEEILKNIRNKD